MKSLSPPSLRPVVLGLLLAGCALAPALAADAPPAKKAAKAPAKKSKTPPAPVEYVPEPASPEQVAAAERVYYGPYGCEFKQTIDITPNAKYPAYVDVKFGKALYVMKPVVSSTGAVRLEDVKGETLMVQIAMKSMMLNVQNGHRVVDDCISPTQRAAIDAANAARIASSQAATGAAVAASAVTEATATAAAASAAPAGSAADSPASAASAAPGAAPAAAPAASAP